MSVLERAKFYSVNDLGNTLHLTRAKDVLDAHVVGKVYSDVNDILELYNVKLLIVDNALRLKGWTDDDYEAFCTKAKLFPRQIVEFFRNLSTDINFTELFQSVNSTYRQDFWDVFESFGLLELLTEERLKKILEDNPDQLENLLQCKRIVEKFDVFLSREMQNNTNALSLLIHAYWVKEEEPHHRPLFMPKSLNLEQKENIIERFLEQDSPSLGLVRIIMQSKDVDGLKVSPEIRLKAKKMEPVLAENEYKKAAIVSQCQVGFTLTFSKEKNILPVQYSIDGLMMNIVYSEEYLDKLDTTRLFNAFVPFFGYLNENDLLTLCYNPREDDFLERINTEHVSGMYRINDSFRHKNSLAVYQLKMFDDYLRRRGLTIEELIKSYYEAHFREDYGYPSATLNLPREDDPFINKCKIIAPEMEGVIKSFDLYVDKGEIDPELLQLRMPLPITLAKSLIHGKHKYAVIVDGKNEIYTPMYLLFSDQSLLSFVNPFKNSRYHTLYNLLVNENTVPYSNYEEHQKPRIDYLIENGYLEVSEDGYLRIQNVAKVNVLGKLYKQMEVSYFHCNQEERKEIDTYVTRGWLKYDEYLLSPNERHFINFYLNNAEYSNGLQLRNKYAHGVTSCKQSDQKEHESAYYYFLMIFVILLLKMDGDLRLASTIN